MPTENNDLNTEFLQSWALRRVMKLKKRLNRIIGDLFVDVEKSKVYEGKIRSDCHDKLSAIQSQLKHLSALLDILNKESSNQGRGPYIQKYYVV